MKTIIVLIFVTPQCAVLIWYSGKIRSVIRYANETLAMTSLWGKIEENISKQNDDENRMLSFSHPRGRLLACVILCTLANDLLGFCTTIVVGQIGKIRKKCNLAKPNLSPLSKSKTRPNQEQIILVRFVPLVIDHNPGYKS